MRDAGPVMRSPRPVQARTKARWWWSFPVGLFSVLLFGCGNGPVDVAHGAASPVPSASPTTAPSPKVTSPAVQKALADLATASAALRKDFAWVVGALPPGGRIANDPEKMSLFPAQRAAAAGARNVAHVALTRARTAAKSKPSDCAAVRREKSTIQQQVPKVQSSLLILRGEASVALSSMAPAVQHRAEVQAALMDLARLASTDAQLRAQLDTVQTIAVSYTQSEQQILTVAVQQAQAAVMRDVNATLATVAAARAVAPYCG